MFNPQRFPWFREEELTVLDTWFGDDDAAPAAAGISHDEARLPCFQKDPPDAGVMLDAAVAQVLLEPVRHRLPSARGNPCALGIVSSRPSGRAPAERQGFLFPRRLFGVAWRDSGRADAWSTTYYATWVPRYEHFVLIAYGSSPKSAGHRELALGRFAADPDPRVIARLVVRHWKSLRNDYGQARWKSLTPGPAVKEDVAEDWAEQVWPNKVVWTGEQRASLSRLSAGRRGLPRPHRRRNTPGAPLRNAFGERVTRKGELLLTHLQLKLLGVILKEPGSCFRSVNAWIDRAAGLPAGATCLRHSISSIPRSLVVKQDAGNRYSCQLTERGRAVLQTDIPIRVLGVGSFYGVKSWLDAQTQPD